MIEMGENVARVRLEDDGLAAASSALVKVLMAVLPMTCCTSGEFRSSCEMLEMLLNEG